MRNGIAAGSVALALLIALGFADGASAASGSLLQFGPFAGYVRLAPVSSIEATWTVPRVLPGSRLGVAGTWIGAQAGGENPAFIQVGITEEHFRPTRDGPVVTAYHAFWSDTKLRFAPSFLLAVAPGDVVSAKLAHAGGRWTIAIRDVTNATSRRLSTAQEGAGHRFDAGLAATRWPRPTQPLIDVLVAHERARIERLRAVGRLSPVALIAWRSAFEHDVATPDKVAHLIRRSLGLPEVG